MGLRFTCRAPHVKLGHHHKGASLPHAMKGITMSTASAPLLATAAPTLMATMPFRVFGEKVDLSIPLNEACAIADGVIANRVAMSSRYDDTVRAECASIAAGCRVDALNAASAAACAAGKAGKDYRLRSANLKLMMRALKAGGK
jgi:hypothetical protein